MRSGGNKLDTITEFRNTKDLVCKILETDVRARNDDKWLCYRVISHFTRVFIPFEDFDKFPSFETISRVRRTIQNKENRFLPDDDISEKREQRKDDVEFLVKLNEL